MMENPTGIIQSLVSDANGTRAIVAVDVSAACPRCASGKGCGAGLLTGRDRERRVEARIRTGDPLQQGDRVEIALAPSNLLLAAVIVYGLPMLGAVLAAALAYALALGDIAAAVAALAGLATGLTIGTWRLRQSSCLSRFVPTVEKRLPRPERGA